MLSNLTDIQRIEMGSNAVERVPIALELKPWW